MRHLARAARLAVEHERGHLCASARARGVTSRRASAHVAARNLDHERQQHEVALAAAAAALFGERRRTAPSDRKLVSMRTHTQRGAWTHSDAPRKAQESCTHVVQQQAQARRAARRHLGLIRPVELDGARIVGVGDRAAAQREEVVALCLLVAQLGAVPLLLRLAQTPICNAPQSAVVVCGTPTQRTTHNAHNTPTTHNAQRTGAHGFVVARGVDAVEMGHRQVAKVAIAGRARDRARHRERVGANQLQRNRAAATTQPPISRVNRRRQRPTHAPRAA